MNSLFYTFIFLGLTCLYFTSSSANAVGVTAPGGVEDASNKTEPKQEATVTTSTVKLQDNISNVTDAPPVGPNTTTVAPDTTTAAPKTTTLPPSTTTPAPNTTTTTEPAPNTTTTPPPSTTTTKPTTTTTPLPTTPTTPTTIKPTTPIPPSSSTTPVSPITTPPTPLPNNRSFDGPSFIGGMVLTVGISAISFVAFKFYKARTERNYHTL